MIDDGGRFNAVCASFFWLLWGLKHDRERTLMNLDDLRGFNGVRVLCAVGESGPPADDSWHDRTIDPRWPDFKDRLRDMFTELRARSMRNIVTVWGDVTRATPDAASRLAHLDCVLDVCLEFPEQVLYIGISNEGIGFPGHDADPEILTLVQRVRNRSSFLVSSVNNIDEGEATVFAAHTPRKVTGDGGIWEHSEQPYDLRSSSRVSADEEPIGPESSVAADDDALRNAAHCATGFISRAPIYVWHCGAGIRGGGAADRARGRHANFRDQPTFAETKRMLFTVRDFLPADIASWSEVHHSDPSREGKYPFKTGPLQPFDPSRWFLKTYANRSGNRFAAVILKIERDVPLQAPRSMSFEIDDLRGSREVVSLAAGETHLVRSRGAVMISGEYT